MTDPEITKIDMFPIENIDIYSAEGGRIINEAVARKLGVIERYQRDWKFPYYCHDIAAAWTIIEWIGKQSFTTRKMFMAHLTAQSIVVEDGSIVQPFWWFLFFAKQPMEICLAFLKL